MVNLAFCKLDVTYLISLAIPKHNIHLFPFRSLQRDDHSCWNFSVDLLSIILFGAFQIASAFLVICCSDFVFQERSLFADLREISGNDDEHGSWFRFAGCCWYHDGFFQTTAGVCSDQGQWIILNFLRFFWSIRQILFTSVPLYYFDLKSDWLPFETFAFGSPPEDLLMLYLLFVPIE